MTTPPHPDDVAAVTAALNDWGGDTDEERAVAIIAALAAARAADPEVAA